jgi:predicted dehydrogenase
MAKVHVGTVGGRAAGTSDDLRPFAEKVKVQALADVALAKAEAFRAAYGGEYATDDPRRVFDDKNVDAVLITTWHDTHAPFSLAAMAAGKHVLIEKPMAMTEKECDDIVAAAERTGVKYMVAFRCRFAKGAQDVKREIPNPENVIAHARYGGIWPETSWAQDPIKGGGQILSQGCHVVDMMFYLAGSDPESVYATGGVFHHSKPDCIDTINAAIRFKNGSVGAFLGGDGGTGRLMMFHPLANGCPFFVMVMDKGRSALAIDHGEDARFESAVPATAWKLPYESRVHREGANGLGNILPTFARCILKDEAPPATAVDGARTTRFILKCFESARTGKIIRF